MFLELTLIRSFWLAVIETTRPELCRVFFEVDLAPFIPEFETFCTIMMVGIAVN